MSLESYEARVFDVFLIVSQYEAALIIGKANSALKTLSVPNHTSNGMGGAE